MTILSSEVLKAAEAWWQRQKEAQFVYGFIGKPIGDNQYEYDVPGKPGLLYVRIANNQNEDLQLAEALNYGALPHPKLLVRMERIAGYLVVQCPVPYSALKLYGKRASAAATAPTVHSIGSGNEDLIESRRMLPGLVYPSPDGGMNVAVYPFAYAGNWYEGPDVDLDGHQPGTDMQRWVIVGVDRSSGEAVLIDGPETPDYLTLEETDLWAIQVPDTVLPLTGVVVTNGQTSITTSTQIADMRFWGIEAGTVDHKVVQGRLNLSQHPTDDALSGNVLYFSPYQGNLLGLHDGSGEWHLHAFDDMSIALPGTFSTNYDVFAYNNGGVPTMELVAWAGANTRATALITQDGVYVKDGDLTKRYLGTLRTGSGTSGYTHDYEEGRLVFNYYNRLGRPLLKRSTSSHTYNGNNWRAWNNDSSIRFEFVQGMVEEQMLVEVVAAITAGAVGVAGAVTVDLNGQSVSDLHGVQNANPGLVQAGSRGLLEPLAGFNYVQGLESGDAGDPPTFSLIEINALLNG